MASLREMGMLKIPDNLSPDKKAAMQTIVDRYNAKNKEINKENLGAMARIGLGSLVSGASFHPILNIPYVGTGLGGALYDAGQAIVEGDTIGDIAKHAGRGFAIGETVGAIPYVGKGVNKLSGGKIGEGIGTIAERVANTDLARNVESSLMSEFNPVRKAITPIKRKMDAGISPFAKTDSNRVFDSANPRHRLQADLINEYNPAPDSYHTWIRNADDIYNFEDTLKPPQFDSDFIGNDFDPSYTWDMAQDAIKNGKMEVYSSYPIENGTFVTPSEMEAQAYAGNGQIYSKKVPLNDVAWIDERQGQYAPIDDFDLLWEKTHNELEKRSARRK